MKGAEIRRRFLDYFAARGHEVRPSSSLVPADDPTLLFTNAGMVQFKKVFLGREEVPWNRAVTSQKCVRAGGKHNDLEEVGKTARHHTFFEMLGNFSFGGYFKAEAAAFAWEFLIDELGLDPDRMVATVHDTDDEAEAIWVDEVGMDPGRVFRLGDEDNFWQMADTGPCGPCSELHYDLRPPEERSARLDLETFVRLSDEGRFLELWNLVFMQFDRDENGVMHPLPAPSIDTGAGLERLAAALQGVDSNFHTDLFRPLLERAAEVVGRPYRADHPSGVSFRVLADHARAVAFLLADGVFPSNEGRGYVLRRILRRAVRHAWILNRREPTLVHVVDAVVDELAPRDHTGTIPGGEAFRLYDTFGFPLDLTQLMAEERGWSVDEEGFEAALEAQRERSRADRAAAGVGAAADDTLEGWTRVAEREQVFVGYSASEVESAVVAVRPEGDRLGLVLASNPFYLESGGQVSDVGFVVGEGWRVEVDEVRRVAGMTAVFGSLSGAFVEPPEVVSAGVMSEVRHDTERNHTATHLLHAALREILGEHVVQRGSLVAPDRLRFDFAHTAPMTPVELTGVEARVNADVWADHPVVVEQMDYAEAVQEGAMALFGEKYGDRVRVVMVPGVSTELWGGTHAHHTGEIGLFKLVSESGVAAGVRRIEAQTGPGAFRHMQSVEHHLEEAAVALKTRPDNVARRAEQLLAERAELESLLEELRRGGGGGGEEVVSEAEVEGPGGPVRLRAVRLKVRDADDARAWGDGFLGAVDSGVAVVAAELPGEKHSLFTFVTDDLVGRGVRADVVVREVAAVAGGRGGGRPHMAQAGVGDPSKVREALESAEAVVRKLAGAS